MESAAIPASPLRRLMGSLAGTPVGGISEWEHVFFMLPDGAPWPEHPVEDCIAEHRAAGVDYLVWNCGRSTVEYQSALPGANPFGVGVSPPGSWAEFRHAMLRRFCPLRRAIECGRREGMPVMGRLTMNRHYGVAQHPDLVGPLAAAHPEFQEREKSGELVASRLCYAFDEVQRERLDIFLEIQRIGVDALVPDFCRQPPMLMYHPALVEPFIKRHRYDPRLTDSSKPEDYREWFQFRADVMTSFMRLLRDSVRDQERRLGRPCPIFARVPDNAPWAMLAYGLDTDAWMAQDLVDGLMLSPFPLTIEAPERWLEHHIARARARGKVCFGGLGSLNLMLGHEHPAKIHADYERWYFPRAAYELVHRQLQAGADGISVYQTETLVHQPYLQELFRDIGDKEAVARRLRELPAAEPPPEHFVGLDWHSSWLGRNGPHGQLLGLKSPAPGSGQSWRLL